MALYTIHHTYYPSSDKKSALAARLTTLHSTTFSIPANFVAVMFRWIGDTEGGRDPNFYVGGHVEQDANFITIQMKPVKDLDGEVKQAKLDAFTTAVWEVWDEVIMRAPKKTFWTGKEKPREEGGKGFVEKRKALHSVFVVEGLGAGFVHGRMVGGV